MTESILSDCTPHFSQRLELSKNPVDSEQQGASSFHYRSQLHQHAEVIIFCNYVDMSDHTLTHDIEVQGHPRADKHQTMTHCELQKQLQACVLLDPRKMINQKKAKCIEYETKYYFLMDVTYLKSDQTSAF